jgi:hypothetical protein
VLPANFVIENRMDRRDKSITSFMTILPPTKRDPGMQYWATYASVGRGVARCPDKRIGAPLLESPIKKYTSSMSISSMCGPIQNANTSVPWELHASKALLAFDSGYPSMTHDRLIP